MKGFVNLCNMLATIAYEILQDAFRIAKNVIPRISLIFKLVLPFQMYYFGKYEGNMKYWLLLPIVVWLVCLFLDRIAEKTGKGKNIPIPQERFTEEDEDGEVSIEQSRLQEMILYVNDVENYFERHHLM